MADADVQNTPVHLLDTVISDLAHSIRHIERLGEEGEEGMSPADQSFNAEHALKHAVAAQEHAHKVRDHLSENDSTAEGFARERAALDIPLRSPASAASCAWSDFIKRLPRR